MLWADSINRAVDEVCIGLWTRYILYNIGVCYVVCVMWWWAMCMLCRWNGLFCALWVEYRQRIVKNVNVCE